MEPVLNWPKLAETVRYNVNSLARQQGVSVRQLRRMFLDRFKRTPHEWLHQLRMQRAVEFLMAKKPVKVIASELEYRDAAHFSRDFKGYYGVSPSDYFEEIERPTQTHHDHIPLGMLSRILAFCWRFAAFTSTLDGIELI